MPKMSAMDEMCLGVRIGSTWLKFAEDALARGLKPASLTDTCTNMHIEGSAEENGYEGDISRPGYERIRAKARSFAHDLLRAGRYPSVRDYFTRKTHALCQR